MFKGIITNGDSMYVEDEEELEEREEDPSDREEDSSDREDDDDEDCLLEELEVDQDGHIIRRRKNKEDELVLDFDE